jgi:enterochelin esterase-like enzyme
LRQDATEVNLTAVRQQRGGWQAGGVTTVLPGVVVGPVVGPQTITFRLDDPDHALLAVSLHEELVRPPGGTALTWADGVWRLELPRPDLRPGGALRMEYALALTHPDGGEEHRPDPGNPLVAPGAFGDRSVVRLPGYRVPTWVDAPLPEGAEGSTSRFDLPVPRFRSAMPLVLWEPPGAGPEDRLPLLVVHDGPEYDALAGMTRLLAHLVAEGRVRPLRAALLGPVPDRRDEAYSASAHYADALVHTAFAWLERTAPQPEDALPVVVGASLGALAALHAAHRHPRRIGGLLLQSGSYFRHRTDPQERGFPRFDRIARFVGEVLRARRSTSPLPITMTCGTVEENLANNEVMATALAGAGHDVTFRRVRDGHTYTAWRDCLDPLLPDLLRRAWP